MIDSVGSATTTFSGYITIDIFVDMVEMPRRSDA
jgi:hypothetical protein